MKDTGDLSNVVAVFNLDTPAVREGSPLVMTNDNAALNAFLGEVAAAVRLPVIVSDRIERYSDHYPFLEQGVPCMFLASRGSPYCWAHTEYDTLDKVTPASFTVPLLVTGVAAIEVAASERTFRS